MQYRGYDRTPVVDVPDSATACVVGWDAIGRLLREAIAARGSAKTVVAVECYAGVDEHGVRDELARRLGPVLIIDAADALLSSARVESLVAPFLGGEDPVFGYLSNLTLPQFFDCDRVAEAQRRLQESERGLALVVGCGATHIAPGDILVYADLVRWEAQQRFRRDEAANLGASDPTVPARLQYKRAYFVDWRVCDRWKRPLMARWDFVLDTNDARAPKLAEGGAVRHGLHLAAGRPFRVVPFFDPAPWGGQWMKEVCDLDREATNYGWCFDCVPEENSLLLTFGNTRFELPAIDLVFWEPDRLLGEAVHGRFGDEFPIRFDLLDTIGGGNLSFQVHPLTEYIQQRFGMHYTQDESYYILDAEPGAGVYLGLREGIDQAAMERELRQAMEPGRSFPVDHYVNRWPSRRHDHFLIPAGTCHCSGAGCLVLEISATPYIFTFKLWDWDRLGLDGKPRPVHLEHGLANIQWERTTGWVEGNLINRVRPVAGAPGWREEATGLHETQFIETRRHWFTGAVPHQTGGTVNVLNLVEGDEVLVESPEQRFAPFVVHHAETFIVPAAAGAYLVRPLSDRPHATMKAFVRHRA